MITAELPTLDPTQTPTPASTPAAAAPHCRCTHCGLDVPTGLIRQNSSVQFCCNGCQTAYQLITSGGLEGYYDMAGSDAAPGILGSRPASVDADADAELAEFDETVALSLCRPCTVGQRRHELIVENIHCGACVWLLERLPRLAPGVLESRVNLGRQSLTVTYSPDRISLRTIAVLLRRLGYPAHLAGRTNVEAVRRNEDRRFIMRISVAGAISGNVMLLAFALYGGVFSGMDAGFFAFFRWLSAALGVLSLAWPGAVFFRSAWTSIRARSINIDVPIVLGLLAGSVSGVLNVILGRSEIYFDSLTMLVFLLLVGRFIQHRQQRGALDSVNLLHSLTPRAARLVDGDSVRTVAAESLRPGDTVEVLPGQSVPVDGLLLDAPRPAESEATDATDVAEETTAYLDEAVLTGESHPRLVHPGDPVRAGTVNLRTPIRVLATATGQDTLAARLMALVEHAAGNKPGIVSFADKVGRHFIIWVGLLAAVIAAGWLIVDPEHPGRALDNATALLIVTCPCALGIAVPLVFAVTMGRAARRGILIKSGQVIERLAGSGTVILDKTGTLTRGQMAVVDRLGDPTAITMAALVEARIAHPIAQAIARLVPEDSEQPTSHIDHVRYTVGRGVTATVEGVSMLIGSPAMATEARAIWDDHLRSEADALAARGLTPVAVVCDGHVRALLGIGDPIRPDARQAIDAMAAQGWSPRVLSGDHPSVVRHVAHALGIPLAAATGSATPQDKLVAVRAAQATGPTGSHRVIMVGDGVNDAAALAAADVGIAVAGGAEASLQAADVYMTSHGLSQISALVDASRRAVRAVWWTLWASLGYNVIAATLAITGHIHPIAAAIMMPASSLTVLAIAARFRTFPVTAGDSAASADFLSAVRPGIAPRSASASPALAGAIS